MISAFALLAGACEVLVFWIVFRKQRDVFEAQAAATAVAVAIQYFQRRTKVAFFILTGCVSWFVLTWLQAETRQPVVRVKVSMVVLTMLVGSRWFAQVDTTGPASERGPAETSYKRMLWWILLLAPLAAGAWGFASNHLLQSRIWDAAGKVHFEKYVAFFAGASAAFFLAAPEWYVPALSAAVLGCSVFALGAPPVAAVLFFLFAATVLGRCLFGALVESSLAFPAGLAVCVLVMYASAWLPVHYWWTWLIALSAVIAANRHAAWSTGREWLRIFVPLRPSGAAEFTAIALIAFLLVAQWLIALKPEISADGLAMHLAIPYDIALHHSFTVDFRQRVWALMPVGADFCYSIVFLMGGEYAARLLNFAMLAETAVLLHGACASLSTRLIAGFLTALFLSTPLVYLVTGSLFVENFVAAVVLAAVIALWRYQAAGSTSSLMLSALLFGTSLSLKLGAAMAAVVGLAVLIFLARRTPALAAGAALLAVSVGSIPYAKAYGLSGNPVFPFENRFFHSPWIQRGIRDASYNHPPGILTPFDLAFRTSRYYEGEDGTFGFQNFVFLPLVVIAGLAASTSFRARSALAVGAVAAATIAVTQPNARYFYFTLPLFTVALAAALERLRSTDAGAFRAGVTTALLAGFGNILLMPAGDWYHRDFYTSPLFSARGRDEYRQNMAPVRGAVAWLNARGTQEPVAFVDSQDTAGVNAPVRINDWMDDSFVREIQRASSAEDVYRTLMTHHIRDLVTDRRRTGRQNSFTELLDACGEPEFALNNISVVKLRSDCAAMLPATHAAVRLMN